MIFDKFRLGKTSKEAQEIVKKRLKLGSEDVRVINYLFYKGYKNWEITEIMKEEYGLNLSSKLISYYKKKYKKAGGKYV